MPYKNSEGSLKKYYTISEVAVLFNVSTSLLRFWEKKFPALRPQKNKQGIRRYTEANVAYLRRIYHLVKEKGYTLQGARVAVDQQRTLTDEEVVKVLHRLKELKEFLISLREVLPSKEV